MATEKTLQQFFDKTARHLMKQYERAVNENGACRYRTDDGLMCAIGCHIPASKYSPDLENCSSTHPQVAKALGVNRYSVLANCLEELQTIHDTKVPGDWYESLSVFANNHNLSIRALDRAAKRYHRGPFAKPSKPGTSIIESPSNQS